MSAGKAPGESRMGALRAALGLSQSDMALFMEASYPNISRLEKRDDMPGIKLQRTVVEALEAIVAGHPTIAAREVREMLAMSRFERLARLFAMAGGVRS